MGTEAIVRKINTFLTSFIAVTLIWMEGIGLHTNKPIHVYSMGVYGCISHLFFFFHISMFPLQYLLELQKQNKTLQLPNESSLAVLLKFQYSTKIFVFCDTATRFAVLNLNPAYQDSYLGRCFAIFSYWKCHFSCFTELKVIKMS